MSEVVEKLSEWQNLRRGPRFAGKSVGFVPTMGALHEGHLALLDRARAENDLVVLSVFVNPAQFDDPNDLTRYPRDLAADLALAGDRVDWTLAPNAAEMYPDGYRYRVTEKVLSLRWEGVQRPGHFDGVLTVVLKLLNLVQADRAYFGEKDWQQLGLVRGMAHALFLPTAIVPCPVVRAPDGLALSSRNRRLSPEARAKAVQFPRILRLARDPAAAEAQLRAAGFVVDYVADEGEGRVGAVRCDGLRLIDYVRL
jgi:pantoate--beta-alanine ligase